MPTAHNVLIKCKVSDPCMLKLDCLNCNILTTDQWAQVATPSYKIKKEKRDSKSDKSDKIEAEDTSSLNLALVLVVGVLNDQKKVKSPGKSMMRDKGKKKLSTPLTARLKPCIRNGHNNFQGLRQCCWPEL